MPSVPRAPKSVPPWAGSSTTMFSPVGRVTGAGAGYVGAGAGVCACGAEAWGWAGGGFCCVSALDGVVLLGVAQGGRSGDGGGADFFGVAHGGRFCDTTGTAGAIAAATTAAPIANLQFKYDARKTFLTSSRIPNLVASLWSCASRSDLNKNARLAGNRVFVTVHTAMNRRVVSGATRRLPRPPVEITGAGNHRERASRRQD